MKFLLLLISLLAVPSFVQAQVKGNVFVEMLEAGGNGAAYGYVSLKAEGRTQGFSCPRVSNGNIPTGRILCDTTYGSSSSSEWQPGDRVTVVVQRTSSASIPQDKRPSDAFSCIWDFAGFTKACTGLGSYDSARDVYECEFLLPLSGDISLGVMISGHDAFNRDCPKLDDPSMPGPTPSASPAATLTPAGNVLLEALIGAVDDLAESLNIGRLTRKVIKKTVFPQTDP
ncbi:MAG: hypothetical protein KDD62_12930, partial [Bdellovibrionales bacterium]|nr:hypothetical protein [Bdellovibrionales bacterium]